MRELDNKGLYLLKFYNFKNTIYNYRQQNGYQCVNKAKLNMQTGEQAELTRFYYKLSKQISL